MQEKLEKVLEEARMQLEKAVSIDDTEEIRIKVMGKKGQLTQILRGMGKLSPEEKKEMGMAANKAKAKFETMLNEKVAMVKEQAKKARFKAETIDVTEPGIIPKVGVKHPITQVINEIVGIFRSMGYAVYESPEVDTVFNTFDGLNSPEFHPARDITDTFYIDKGIVLRPHTSSGEVRAEKELQVPYKVILMAKKLFGPATKTKFRPHHFPFTEPSAEMDVSCFKCGGKGCNVCKGSGWIEILGCGMTHPHVHEAGGIDSEKYTGFAVGMGVERIAMLKYGIDDIRLLYENDMRFIDQFK